MSKTNTENDTTHFGFEDVKLEDKVNRVKDVFDSVSSKYDIMNDVMSMGVHRIWKHSTINRTGLKLGDNVLDLAGGTGDLASAMYPIVGKTGHIVLSDINASMLNEGRSRLINEGKIGHISFVQADAEQLPFADNSFDLVTMAFGLRNVTTKENALKSIYRVLKPGGKLMVLEFSKPTNPILDKAYDMYSFNILPKLGGLIAGDEDSYRYLAESIRKHPEQEALKSMFKDAGFEYNNYENFTGGIVALHTGVKLEK